MTRDENEVSKGAVPPVAGKGVAVRSQPDSRTVGVHSRTDFLEHRFSGWVGGIEMRLRKGFDGSI